MTAKRQGLAFLPPFLAGLAGAVAVETSTGVLLFADQGFLPALTLILTIEMGALGLGLWSGPLPVSGGVPEQIRRRWIFCLMAFALAAALSAGLTATGDLPRSGVGQGVGLGILGGLPLFSIGTLLGSMSRAGEAGRFPNPPVGAPAVLGAAGGFLLAGSVLLPNAAPYTLFLSCLVVLSGGALIQGWVLDGQPWVEVLEIVPAGTGELRMEERAVGSPDQEVKVLLEGGRLRGAEDPEGNPGRRWEAGILEGLSREERRPASLLYLGGGSGTLVRLLSQRFPETRIHVVERSRQLITLARSHFAEWDGWDEACLQFGEPLAASLETQGPFSMIVVDCGALPVLGGVPFLRDWDWRFLLDNLETGGVVMMGGLHSHIQDAESPLGDVVRVGRQWFEEVSLYRSEPVPTVRGLLQDVEGEAEYLLLFSSAEAASWPLSLSGFQLRPAQEG